VSNVQTKALTTAHRIHFALNNSHTSTYTNSIQNSPASVKFVH